MAAETITQDTLINTVKAYAPKADIRLLKDACEFSRQAHGEQKRASGDPYYYHPLEVALILSDIKIDVTSIITALLHDTVEDTHVTSEDIKQRFGEEVATLVDGVTKLTKIESQSEYVRQAENFRKLLVAMSEDIRVLLVKLADRLHNMRTLHFVKSPEKRMRIAHETMEIYAPLAERIGMQQMKNELQDLAFATLHPEARDSIISRLEYLRKHGHILVEKIINEISDKINQSGIKAEVIGREKTPCSIWRKMERKNISFEQLSDIMAFRILTDDVESCYRVLGVIHTKYQMIPGSFKDFISTPKHNGYQSLHTVIMGPQQRFVEVQIRTHEMHQIAELGVAAHWAYKQVRDYNTDGKQYKWIRELLYILEHTSDSEEFLESTKMEMYYDQVFCFTPRGDLIALPKGATTVDFAFAVHSDVGMRCAGAKVNGSIVSLRTQLFNGDQVQIITSKTQSPSPEWEQFAITAKAKGEIRRFVRGKKRQEYGKLGRSIVKKTLEEEGLQFSKDVLEPVLPIVGKKELDELYIAVGEGVITTAELLKALFPNRKQKSKKRNPFSILRFKKENKSSAIPIKGLVPGMAVSFAECCHPIPGDSIVGVVATGKGMTVHTSDCQILENFASTPERLMDISWEKGSDASSHIGRLKVVLAHEAGSLAALANAIAQDNGNINNLKIVNRTPDFFEVAVDVDVRGAGHLTNIIASLRTLPCIHAVERYRQ
jgi:GTP pyrophosphokinase